MIYPVDGVIHHHLNNQGLVFHERVSENGGDRGAHIYAIHLGVESPLEKHVSFFSCKLEKPLKIIFRAKFESWTASCNVFNRKVRHSSKGMVVTRLLASKETINYHEVINC